MHQFRHVLEHKARIGSCPVHFVELGERGGRLAAHQCLEQVVDIQPVGEPQHLVHGVRGDPAAVGLRDCLVQYGEAVPHRAVGGARDPRQRFRLDFGTFLRDHGGEMRFQHPGRDPAKVEALAAGEHRYRHGLRIWVVARDEFHMLRRLLQRLQQGIERILRESMCTSSTI